MMQNPARRHAQTRPGTWPLGEVDHVVRQLQLRYYLTPPWKIAAAMAVARSSISPEEGESRLLDYANTLLH